ncbi:PP2C family serine/threonine-protein phosphatase [Pseudoduganella sp. HUAS MS19]
MASKFHAHAAERAVPHSTTRLPGGIGFRLQNARSGETYAQCLQAEPDAGRAVVFERIDIDPGLGLAADPASGLIHGTPGAPGQYQLTVHYHFAAQAAVRHRASVALVVVANPKAMWKNLPSDTSAPFWKPDEQGSAVHGAGLRTIGASKRGRSHAHAGQFRDDDFRTVHLEQAGWHIAVVADGAGSARYSRRGAELICTSAAAALQQSLAGAIGRRIEQGVSSLYGGQSDSPALRQALLEALGDAARQAYSAIQDECSHGPLPAENKDFASTAMIALCRRFPSGTLCAAFQVGDGAVAAYSAAGGVTLLGAADAGEYAGETRFLGEDALSPPALAARVRFTLAEDFTALLLMTDGVSEPLFDSDSALASNESWHAFWHTLEQEAGLSDADASERKLLSWLDFWSTGHHDDRTIVIIY